MRGIKCMYFTLLYRWKWTHSATATPKQFTGLINVEPGKTDSMESCDPCSSTRITVIQIYCEVWNVMDGVWRSCPIDILCGQSSELDEQRTKTGDNSVLAGVNQKHSSQRWGEAGIYYVYMNWSPGLGQSWWQTARACMGAADARGLCFEFCARGSLRGRVSNFIMLFISSKCSSDSTHASRVSSDENLVRRGGVGWHCDRITAASDSIESNSN